MTQRFIKAKRAASQIQNLLPIAQPLPEIRRHAAPYGGALFFRHDHTSLAQDAQVLGHRGLDDFEPCSEVSDVGALFFQEKMDNAPTGRVRKRFENFRAASGEHA